MELDLSYWAAFLALISSVVAFFYKKDGERFQVKGIGLIALTLLLLIGGLNLYSAYDSAKKTSLANKRALAENAKVEELRNENRLAQSALQMQYLDHNKPFTYGQIAFSIVQFEPENPDAVPHPLGANNFVIFKINEPNSNVGWMSVGISETDNIRVDLSVNANGDVVVVQEGEEGKVPKSYKLTSKRSCSFTGESECETDELPDGAPMSLEQLAAIDGNYHLGIDSKKFTTEPSLVVLSRLLQDTYIGSAVIEAKPTDIKQAKFYYEKIVNGRVYFVQDYNPESPLTSCRRTARLPIKISVVDKFPDSFEEKCSKGNICLMFEHEANITVNACQLSEF